MKRLNYLRIAFFAPDSDAGVWLRGWYPDVDEAQFAAGRATRQSIAYNRHEYSHPPKIFCGRRPA
jgi:hypothetical protein